MISRSIVLGLLAVGCVTAAAGGGYLAVRQNETDRATGSTLASSTTPSASQPVVETEAVVSPSLPTAPPAPVEKPSTEGAASDVGRPPVTAKAEVPRRATTARRSTPQPQRSTAVGTPARPAAGEPAGPAREPVTPSTAFPIEPTEPEPVRFPEPVPAPREPAFVEVVVPASSVIGLQVDTPLSTERARVEDRVEARVTRDVASAGRVAIPAGSRVLGSVTLVDRGGKVKDRARLGVRFHTIVFADGTELPIRTEAIYREGESPTGESAAKIGGAAAGGAILGAILGGGKGAVLGGATGAGAGTAAVMAGGRNAATLPAGTVVTVRLASPVAVDVKQ